MRRVLRLIKAAAICTDSEKKSGIMGGRPNSPFLSHNSSESPIEIISRLSVSHAVTHAELHRLSRRPTDRDCDTRPCHVIPAPPAPPPSRVDSRALCTGEKGMSRASAPDKPRSLVLPARARWYSSKCMPRARGRDVQQTWRQIDLKTIDTATMKSILILL